ncbi:hypothetical protein [Nonomuraea dietziae]|uniref:hypothetical protein n=1 Tax=Nonomuraea dietziae TaxID=65515 RepID=UPI0033E90DFA
MPINVATSPPRNAMYAFDGHLPVGPFDAPANSLLVAGWAGTSNDNPTINGGGLTWTARRRSANNRVAIWTAPCPTPKTGITITADDTDGLFGGLKVWILTGADNAAPAGATGANTSTANAVTVSGYTSTRPGSLGFCVAFESVIDGGAGVMPTSTDVAEAYSARDAYAGAGAGLFLRKAAAASAAGEVVTFRLDAAGTATASWEWAAVEILPPADQTPPTVPGNLRVVEVTGTSLSVAWDASTDASGIAGYGVWLDGVKVTGP